MPAKSAAWSKKTKSQLYGNLSVSILQIVKPISDHQTVAKAWKVDAF